MTTATQIKITHTIRNYTRTNIVGQVADWGSKPGRLVSISYVCEGGYVVVRNRRNPHQFTIDFFKEGKCVTGQFRLGKVSVDWDTEKSSIKSTRMVTR